jgi:hypothetical protein
VHFARKGHFTPEKGVGYDAAQVRSLRQMGMVIPHLAVFYDEADAKAFARVVKRAYPLLPRPRIQAVTIGYSDEA